MPMPGWSSFRIAEAFSVKLDSVRHWRCLDDWGLAPLTAEQRRDLLEIVDDRHGRASTLITSQVPVEYWHDIIGDPTLADAILYRLVHNAHLIVLKGESMRKITAERDRLDAAAAS